MATGDLLNAEFGTNRLPMAQGRMGASEASLLALQVYILQWVFLVRADGVPDREFRLAGVDADWPDPAQKIIEPRASLVESSSTDEPTQPSMCDGTYGTWGKGTVLWSLGSMSTRIQLDLWMPTRAERDAAARALEEYFSPTEGSRTIWLEAPEEYWSTPIRYSLIERDPTGDQSTNEWRMSATVQADIPILQLRQACELRPRITVDDELVPLVAAEAESSSD
jgi:hypothetical protein